MACMEAPTQGSDERGFTAYQPVLMARERMVRPTVGLTLSAYAEKATTVTPATLMVRSTLKAVFQSQISEEAARHPCAGMPRINSQTVRHLYATRRTSSHSGWD